MSDGGLNAVQYCRCKAVEDDTARVIELPLGATRRGMVCRARRHSVVICGLRVDAKTSLAAARLASRDTLTGELAYGRVS